MQTIRLRINDKIYKHLMWLLSRFTTDEIQVIREDDEFISVSEYLRKELAEIENGTTEFVSIDYMDNELDKTLKKYEA